MSNTAEVLYDLPPIEEIEEAYQVRYVRLAYPSVEDLPNRLYQQLMPGRMGTLPAVTDMVGLVVDADEPTPARHIDTLDDLRFTVEFGGRPELLVGVHFADLVRVEDVPEEMGSPRLAKRRQFARADEEALARRGEGLDATEDSVLEERLHRDPTGTGEGGVPSIEQEERATPGKGADQITKIYLQDRKEPVLVHGELEHVVLRLESVDPNAGLDISIGATIEIPRPLDVIVSRQFVQFQRVNRDGMVSADDVAINPAYVISVQSDRVL